jgi:hypothetical protein
VPQAVPRPPSVSRAGESLIVALARSQMLVYAPFRRLRGLTKRSINMALPTQEQRRAAEIRQAYMAGKSSVPLRQPCLIYRPGQKQQAFYTGQGQHRVNIDPEGAYVEAGDGANRAQVLLPMQKEYIPVKAQRPLYRRKATWFIGLLILLVVGGVIGGVAYHEINKSNY